MDSDNSYRTAKPPWKPEIENRRARIDNLLCLAAALSALAGCSQPDLRELRHRHASLELAAWRNRRVVLKGPLTLERASALALAHNLRVKVARLEAELQHEAATGEKLRMLPRLQFTAEYGVQDRQRIAFSEAADTGRQSLEPSLATDRHTRTGSLELVWGLLDFGISFLRGRQAANEARLADQSLRRTAQILLLEVTRAYYEAAIASSVSLLCNRLLADLKEARAVLRAQVAGKAVSELDGLSRSDGLILLEIRLQAIMRRHAGAQTRLAALVGLAPGQEVEFPADLLDRVPAHRTLVVGKLEMEALGKRPELFQDDLRQLIAADEVRASLASLFPSPAGFLGAYNDQNKFLRSKHWVGAGVRLSTDLLSFPRRWARYHQSQGLEDLSARRRMVTAMGILAQVHLSVLAYERALAEYQLAAEHSLVRKQLLEALQKRTARGQVGPERILPARASALFTWIRKLEGLAALVEAGGRIDHTVGRDVGR